MASADSTVTRNVVYLISGANRGIGFALTKTLSQRPNHVIYAGTRSPPAKNNDALRQLADETSRSVRIVQLSSGSSLDEAALVQQIKAEEGHIDALIANAGIANHEAQAKTKDASFDHVMDHFRVNTLGPWSLYKSIYPLLKEAPRGAKFITISSRLGSLGAIKDLPVPAVTYSISKASVNFLMLKTHSETEDEGFVVFPMCPGWVSAC